MFSLLLILMPIIVHMADIQVYNITTIITISGAKGECEVRQKMENNLINLAKMVRILLT